MEKNYLVVNIGSASKKYALYKNSTSICSYHFESDGHGLTVSCGDAIRTETKQITEEQYDRALSYVLDELVLKKIIANKKDIAAVGFRVVAPGSYFAEHRVIDQKYMREIKARLPDDPLHLSFMLSELEQIAGFLKDVPVVGVSDSAFHSTMPERSRRYAISKKISEEFDVIRFGYHGISLASIVKKLSAFDGGILEKVIVCHLGSGASVTALKNGKSIDTSMGFTPLEGLVMATRPGDIDAGAVLAILKKKKLTASELEKYLYAECGLKGVSGKSSDVRELLNLEKEDDVDAALALEQFAYRIKKYIGAYAAALGGLDMLVFSGTIGERSFIMRSRICDDLSYLGIEIDAKKNNSLVSADGFIESANTKTKVAVITSDEAGEIAAQMNDFKLK